MPTSSARARICGTNAGRNSRTRSHTASEVAVARCSKPRCTRRYRKSERESHGICKLGESSASEQYDGCDEHKRCQGPSD
jgi:hypothetical protein